jgi:hypothetical protein
MSANWLGSAVEGRSESMSEPLCHDSLSDTSSVSVEAVIVVPVCVVLVNVVRVSVVLVMVVPVPAWLFAAGLRRGWRVSLDFFRVGVAGRSDSDSSITSMRSDRSSPPPALYVRVLLLEGCVDRLRDSEGSSDAGRLGYTLIPSSGRLDLDDWTRIPSSWYCFLRIGLTRIPSCESLGLRGLVVPSVEWV